MFGSAVFVGCLQRHLLACLAREGKRPSLDFQKDSGLSDIAEGRSILCLVISDGRWESRDARLWRWRWRLSSVANLATDDSISLTTPSRRARFGRGVPSTTASEPSSSLVVPSRWHAKPMRSWSRDQRSSASSADRKFVRCFARGSRTRHGEKCRLGPTGGEGLTFTAFVR
jgi:hypothetical protein